MLLLSLLAGNLWAAPKAKRPLAKRAPAKPAASAPTVARGEQLLKDGKLPEAIAELRKAIDSGKTPAMACVILAEAHRRYGEIAEAADVEAAFLDKADPANPEEAAVAAKILRQRLEKRPRGIRVEHLPDLKRYAAFAPNPAEDIEMLEAISRELGIWRDAESGPRCAEAIAAFRALADRFPREDRLRRDLAYIHANRGELGGDDERFLQEQTRLHPDDPVMWEYLGHLCDQAGRKAKGAECFEKSLALGGKLDEFGYALPAYYEETQRIGDAVRVRKLLSERDKDSLVTQVIHAEKLLSYRSDPAYLEDLRQYYAKRLAENPESAGSLAAMSFVLGKLGRSAEADAMLAKAVEDLRDQSQWQAAAFNLGYCGKYEASARLFTRLSRLHPETDYGQSILSMLGPAPGAENSPQRMAIYRRIAAVPGIPGSFVATICDRLANTAAVETQELAEIALKTNPNDPALLRARAGGLVQQGKGAEAIALLKDAAFKAGNPSQALHDALCEVTLGVAWRVDDSGEAMKPFEELIHTYELAIERNPSDVSLRKALGKIHLTLQRPDPALKEFGEASRLAPKDVEALAGLARALELVGKAEESLATWRRALDLTPGLEQACTAMARLYPRLKRSEEGMAALRQAVAAHPENPYFPQDLAKLCLVAGKPEAAVSALRAALMNAGEVPDNDMWVSEFMNCCRENGTRDEGLVALRRAIEAGPSDPRVAKMLGQACMQADRRDDAARAFSIALRGSGSSGFVVTVYDILFGGQDAAVAVEAILLVPLKNEEKARQLLTWMGEAVDYASSNGEPDALADLIRKADRFADNIAAKYPATETAARASYDRIHWSLSTRVPSKGVPNKAEADRVLGELAEVQRLYPDSPVVGDCALDILRVLGILNRTDEHHAYRDRIAGGEFGELAAVEALTERGRAHQKAQRNPEAMADLSRAVALGEKNAIDRNKLAWIQMDLARVYLAMGQTAKAKAILEPMAKSDSGLAEVAQQMLAK